MEPRKEPEAPAFRLLRRLLWPPLADHEENIFDDFFAELPVDFLHDGFFEVLELLHPDRARYFYEKRPLANFFRLRVARDHVTDRFVPYRPYAVFSQPS